MNETSRNKHPRFDVRVKLVNTDGNAYAIMGKCKEALRKGGASPEEVKTFLDECMSGDYQHLLQTCTRWLVVS
jgi:hypothetical protein